MSDIENRLEELTKEIADLKAATEEGIRYGGRVPEELRPYLSALEKMISDGIQKAVEARNSAQKGGSK